MREPCNLRTRDLNKQQIALILKFFTLEGGVFLFPTSQGGSGGESSTEIGCLNPDCPGRPHLSQFNTGASKNFQIPGLSWKLTPNADESPTFLWGLHVPGKKIGSTVASGIEGIEEVIYLEVSLPVITLLWAIQSDYMVEIPLSTILEKNPKYILKNLL